MTADKVQVNVQVNAQVPRASLIASALDVEAGGRVILRGVNCTVEPGKVTALVGPNGAGKSTLLRVLSSAQAPQAGSLRYGDRDWLSVPRRERARIAAFVEQDASTELAMTVREVVALGRTPFAGLFTGETSADREAIETSMTDSEVEQFAVRQFSTLSGGEQQRVHIARAFAQQPKLLLLDEPTNHLDIHAQLSVLGLLRQKTLETNLGVLTALHDLNLAASYADVVVLLAAGRVVAMGEPSSVLTAEAIGDVYRVRAKVITNPLTGKPLIAFSDAPSERKAS